MYNWQLLVNKSKTETFELVCDILLQTMDFEEAEEFAYHVKWFFSKITPEIEKTLERKKINNPEVMNNVQLSEDSREQL